jgi:hypothetical protein
MGLIIKKKKQGRPKTSGDELKKERIRQALSDGKEKYLQEISRISKIAPSTIYSYINSTNGFMRDEVFVTNTAGTAKNKIVIYYRLRKVKPNG